MSWVLMPSFPDKVTIHKFVMSEAAFKLPDYFNISFYLKEKDSAYWQEARTPIPALFLFYIFWDT